MESQDAGVTCKQTATAGVFDTDAGFDGPGDGGDQEEEQKEQF